MNKTRSLIALATVAALSGVGVGAWWLGMKQGRGDTTSATAQQAVSTSALDDPSQWTIPQGEAATRRHIRDALKAGDVDPVTGRRILNYHDPMVPGKNFDTPAKSPFMDMMLVPRYVGSNAADTSSVSVSPRIQQNLGLRTAPVVEGALVSEVTAVGNVAWNERERVELSSRAMGFVEKLHVKAALDRVAAGAPLAELYVPDWVSAQEEYLALARLSGPGIEALQDAARQRMRQAGMTTAQIERAVASGRVQSRFTITAPIAGIVSELLVREGATVMPGATLMRLQGTRTVWAEGAVPESQAALLQPGARVRTTSPGAPGQTFEGQVQALLPEVDAVTRTIRARVELANPQGRLVPGMLVSMRLALPKTAASLLVPSDAVIHTGRRSVVMVAEDGGRFRPVEVTAGLEVGGQTEISAGLQLGQRVVLSGQFLIDSEASLRGLEARLNQEPATTPTPTQQRYTTDAVIDALSGDTVTLTHPPIPALKWPQMQMGFQLPPRSEQPRDLKAGDRLKIEFEMQDGQVPRITSLQRVAPGIGK
ncbi:MAG: efflux RND transporter periplasmic adaptor subunit [Hydrogenophaga sp.]|jgi:Cu(I)/Ag(I) efflux system membrane fusion protein|uniref:efflux RND transporter periplasmic adaptor subunit n=1 Tax=Hydrogenophaga sp. TaxID=1904254 RepID=UPI0025B97876|nr:efflux RND transporter periplasmic adaptor subunit [Hydrogenophaga sp.]MBU7575902.1 efflux RND transporter periplasmic adaptor subunit [Hydrogenophaga sp.]